MFNIAAYGRSIANGLENNQDSVLIKEINDFVILVVADGNGADSAGMINTGLLANNLMIDYLTKIIHQMSSINEIANQLNLGMYTISKCFLSINSIDEKFSNVYASQSIVIINKNTLDMCFASIGNTEIHLFRSGELNRMNILQSKAYEMLINKSLLLSDFYNCPERGILTSAYGVFESINVDLRIGKFNPNDIIILTTDGIFTLLNPNNLIKLLGQGESPTPQSGVENILSHISNKNNKLDNAGMICAYIEEI